MSIQQIQTLRDAAIVPLTAKRWEDSRTNAERLIGQRLTAPSRSTYKALDSQYPPRLIGIVVVMLLIVALAALYISAGKEIAVVDTVMRDLVSYYPRLTAAYIEVAIIGVLLLAELGALLFGLASRVLASRRVHGQLMRAFQLACVTVAIVGNMTITLSHPVVEAIVFDWVLTLGAPLLVIGIGAIIEELLATWLLARQQAIRDFNQALNVYQSAMADPESHPDFFRLWGECIFEQILKQSGHNRDALPPLLESDPGLKLVVVSMEWARHDWQFTADIAAEIAGRITKWNDVPSLKQPEPSQRSSPETLELIETTRNVSLVSSGTPLETAKAALSQYGDLLAKMSLSQLETWSEASGNKISRATWNRARLSLSSSSLNVDSSEEAN